MIYAPPFDPENPLDRRTHASYKLYICIHRSVSMPYAHILSSPVSTAFLFSLYSITAVLVSRFLLHLQSVHQSGADGYGESHALFESVGTLVFERVVGSLAQPTETSVGNCENLEHDAYELEDPTKSKDDLTQTFNRVGGTSARGRACESDGIDEVPIR